MSAAGITDALCRALEAGQHDFLLCNFANADMVGHTGVMPAVIKAVETVDSCLEPHAGECGAGRAQRPRHGRPRQLRDDDRPATGGVHTAHTTNPVPLVAVRAGASALRGGGSLRDVAPTVLGLLGIEPPAEMTGRDLRECWRDGSPFREGAHGIRAGRQLALASRPPRAGPRRSATRPGPRPTAISGRATPSPPCSATSAAPAGAFGSRLTMDRCTASATTFAPAPRSSSGSASPAQTSSG